MSIQSLSSHKQVYTVVRIENGNPVVYDGDYRTGLYRCFYFDSSCLYYKEIQTLFNLENRPAKQWPFRDPWVHYWVDQELARIFKEIEEDKTLSIKVINGIAAYELYFSHIIENCSPESLLWNKPLASLNLLKRWFELRCANYVDELKKENALFNDKLKQFAIAELIKHEIAYERKQKRQSAYGIEDAFVITEYIDWLTNESANETDHIGQPAPAAQVIITQNTEIQKADVPTPTKTPSFNDHTLGFDLLFPKDPHRAINLREQIKDLCLSAVTSDAALCGFIHSAIENNALPDGNDKNLHLKILYVELKKEIKQGMRYRSDKKGFWIAKAKTDKYYKP